MKTPLAKVVVLMGMVLAGGCSLVREAPEKTEGAGTGVHFSKEHGGLSLARSVEIAVSREAYQRALGDPALLGRLRLIPLTRADPQQRLMEYRLFNIVAGSPYEMLGLKNADVLLAANDFVIFDPEKFKMFAALIPREESATIDIRRGDTPMQFKITWVP